MCGIHIGSVPMLYSVSGEVNVFDHVASTCYMCVPYNKQSTDLACKDITINT